MFLYFFYNFFTTKIGKMKKKKKKNLFESSSSSFLFNPSLKVFLRVLRCNPRKRRVFIRLKVETHKTASFWLLEA